MTNKVTLYISMDSSLQSVRKLVQREMIASGNVKDKFTRQQVHAALRNIDTFLAGLKRIPPNGLILFSSAEQVETIEPPVPCRTNIYRCATEFYREPLDAMIDESKGEKTGLILIDTNDASISWFRGEVAVPIWEGASGVMGKHSKGGQSQRRFERGHEQQRKAWWRKVADLASQSFLSLGITKVLVGGPGFIKHDMLKDGVLDYRLNVIGTVDCGYVDPIAGAREALARWRMGSNGER
jgi:peptide chain release factor subunit 1